MFASMKFDYTGGGDGGANIRHKSTMYVIHSGTDLFRRVAFGPWEPFVTTKTVYYTKSDFVNGIPTELEYVYIKLPQEALPYIQLKVLKDDVKPF
jgi:hypothetical protein